MYKTVRQGESCLQYRIVGQEEYRRTVKRSRSGRIACLLTGALVVACLTVAGAVLMPILLTTNIVALPAGLHTFALRPQPAQLQQQQQYIAIVPVREAKFRIVGQQEALNGTLQPALLTAQWAGLALWKSYGAWRIAVPILSLTIVVLGIVVFFLRRHHLQHHHHRYSSAEIGRERGVKGTLLAEVSEDE